MSKLVFTDYLILKFTQVCRDFYHAQLYSKTKAILPTELIPFFKFKMIDYSFNETSIERIRLGKNL